MARFAPAEQYVYSKEYPLIPSYSKDLMLCFSVELAKNALN